MTNLSGKKHICLVSPSFNIGGIERTMTTLANYFVSQGCKVSFLSCLDGTPYYTMDNSIVIYSPVKKRAKGSFGKILSYLRLVFFIRETLKKNNPDRVLCMADSYNPIVILASLGLRVPVFIGDVTKPDRHFNLFVRLGKRFLYPKSAGFIAQTNHAANFYRKKFGNKLNLTVINGAVKEMVLHNIPKKNLIISVGRLSFEKGPDRLINAFSLTNCKNDWKLAFTSDGPMRDQLIKLTRNSEVDRNTLFLGKIDDIDRLYSEAKIFILPSRMEGFPNALCEAMASGLPCICFDSFPAHEIITNGWDGIIVKDGDIREMAKQIDLLAENEELRNKLGENALQIRERLNTEKIGQQVLNFILKQ